MNRRPISLSLRRQVAGHFFLIVVALLCAENLLRAGPPPSHDYLHDGRPMTRLLCVPFESGRPKMSPSEEAVLVWEASQPAILSRLRDTATILVVIGYVDARGEAEENKRTAFRRAQMVIDLLHDKCQFMGSSEAATVPVADLPEKERRAKETTVEVWLVNP